MDQKGKGGLPGIFETKLSICMKFVWADWRLPDAGVTVFDRALSWI